MSNGGVLGRRNVPGVDGTSGVWSLREIAHARRAGEWPPEPYFANVVALIHMDGSDGNSQFTDVKGHAFQPAGNAQIDTAQSKFGGASGLFDGSGDYLTTSVESADFTMGSGDFTIEFFIRPAVVGTGYCGLLSLPLNGYQTGGFYLRRNLGVLEILMNGVPTPVVSSLAAWSANVWVHVAASRASGVVRLFVNGVVQGSATNTTNLTGATCRVAFDQQDLSNAFNGHIDELRITKGVARYTANFTPPIEPFPNA